ncbi:hypothetical protein C8J56DRAFT_941236 [Mycena floridula]|nr:hypothetical protein C8J56DRAFT_941236 [Mycena floridula]
MPVMSRKGCLKTPMPSPSLDGVQKKKCVVFHAGEEEVHFADEWDRTPAEPSPRLSYSDMLEFNAIQRSLYHANQPCDPFTGKAATQYLSAVPVGLLPLLPEGSGSNPLPPSPLSSSSPSAETFRMPSAERPLLRPTPKVWHPSDLSHLPRSAAPPRAKPKFSFVPLLDTPPNSTATTPTSSTPTSRNMSPVAAPASPSTNPEYFSLPPPKMAQESYFDRLPAAVKALRLEAVPSPGLCPPSPLSLSRATTPTPDQEVLRDSTPMRRKRNIIVVNDMEIELDDDEEEEEEPSTALSTGTQAIPIPSKAAPLSVNTTPTLSSSASSVSSHSTTASRFWSYESDHSQGGLNSPLTSPISSYQSSPLCSPSTSPKLSSSPPFRQCSSVKAAGRALRPSSKSSPVLVPSA